MAESRPHVSAPGTPVTERGCHSPTPLSAAERAALTAPGEVRAVVVTGSLGLTTVPDVRKRLLRACDGPGIRLLLDLSGVTSCDTLGLGLLIAAARRARSLGSGLRLVAPSPAVVDALGTSGLIRFFRILPDIEAATRTPAAGTPEPHFPEAA
ncbi:STAS domain-containing protein [Streptomyces sp. NPDC050485]|uniref:STAS domain-containing protein n=1 Tax=Streptomyces sp. NPDC050485 TaxID=3365617 RepID=UPI0037934E89